MKHLISVCLLLVLVFSNVQPHPPPIISHAPKTYRVNVDDPPLVRWAPLIKDYKQAIK